MGMGDDKEPSTQRPFRLYDFKRNPRPTKVEFPSLDHFLDDIAASEIETVRMDVFEMVRASELSFVHYVTLMLYVTAQEPTTSTIYEYAEPIATLVSSDEIVDDETAARAAQARMQEVSERVKQIVPRIRHGRFTIPPEEAE